MIRRRWNLKGVALAAAFGAAAVAVLTFYVWYQTESVKLGLDIDTCDQKIQELQESIEALKVRRAMLLDPGRIEKIARDRLGLVEPVDEDIVFRKLGTPQ